MRLPEGHPIVPVCAKCGHRSRESFVIRGGAVEAEITVRDIEEGWQRAGQANKAEWLARAETGDWQPWPRRQLGSFIRPCRCGNSQEIRLEKFQRLIREASDRGEDWIAL
jgi:hypothetical protein